MRLTSDAEVRALNAEWRGKDKPTNVLSFPMAEADELDDADADGPELMLGDIVLARGVCAAEAADKAISIEAHASHLLVHGTLHLLGYDHHDDDAAERHGSARSAGAGAARASPTPMQGDALMATRNDDEDGGSRLWRGMRALIFGEDHEATLRDQIEDAIDEADAAAPKRGDLSPARAADAAQPAPLRRPHRGRDRGHARRHRLGARDDQLRRSGRGLRRGRAQPPAGDRRQPR